MKFVWVPSTRRFRRTETEVKKEKLAYEVVEFETDKDALIDRFNSYEQRIEELEQQIGSREVIEAPEPEAQPERVSPSPPAPVPPPEPANDPFENVADLNPGQLAPVVESAVTRLGELGEEGFEALDAFQDTQGVGSSFSRGVHLLNVIAAGEHQLARILFRTRKVRKWG